MWIFAILHTYVDIWYFTYVDIWYFTYVVVWYITFVCVVWHITFVCVVWYITYVVIWYIFWKFCILSPVLVRCTKKNLAAQPHDRLKASCSAGFTHWHLVIRSSGGSVLLADSLGQSCM
jgi:hypothetical protein